MERGKVLRILDANFNRLREGLRVLEEAQRLGKNKKGAFKDLKRLRHRVAECLACFSAKELLLARDTENDVGGEGATASEMRRIDFADILSANFKRCEEAARVLEEYSKLVNPEASVIAKDLRFKLYEVEKKWLV